MLIGEDRMISGGGGTERMAMDEEKEASHEGRSK